MVKRFLSVLLFFALAAMPLPAFAQNPAPEKLAHEMGERMMRVPEFEFIRAEAEKLGVRVYLFGGTAAAYGHYVRQDLAREAGDKRYPDHLYDYDYTNIFRSTQDLDVVVDGSAEQAAQLESVLKSKFPHFIGDKSAGWEVRPLREARGEKEAILGNPNFLNQHTDSHSTGMVEITKTPSEESAVRDVRDWSSQKPQFLRDIAEQKLHYYFNPLHGETDRAAKGLNPPILSVIRYLTKAFQYDLEISGEDRKKIQEIIDAFKPEDINNDYLKRWVEKNGKKLFQHSVNLEKSWNTLNDLGLRKKLILVKDNPREIESLAWWMSKEPLRSDTVGKGAGRTAAEIAKELGEKELVLAHETNGYLAYESLTRSKAGDLNALISREKTVGEAAARGEGFYTKIGRKGARGTGFTVRMVLDPKAREGTDFIRSGDFIVLKNKAAVKVIPEQINISLLEYLRIIVTGKEFSSDDRALLEAFKRKITRTGVLSPKEEEEIFALAKEKLKSPKPILPFWEEYFSLPLSEKKPEILEELIERDIGDSWTVGVFKHPHWQNHPKFVDALIKRGKVDFVVAMFLLSKPHWRNHPEWVETLIKRGAVDDDLAQYVLSQPHWQNHPEWIETLIKRGKADTYIAQYVLSHPHWQNHPEWVEALIKNGKADKEIARYVLSQPHWRNHPELVKALINRGGADAHIAQYVLSQPHWQNNPELVAALIKNGKGNREIADYVFSRPYWQKHPELVKDLIKGGGADPQVALLVLPQPGWQNHPELVKALIERGEVDSHIAKNVLSLPHWQNHPELVAALIKNGKVDKEIAQYVLSQPHWQNHPELVKALIKNGKAGKEIAQYVLSQPHWQNHPELVKDLIKGGLVDDRISQYVLSQPHWQNHPELVAALVKDGKDDLSLVEHVLSKPHWKNHPEWVEVLLKKGTADSQIARFVLSQPHWQNHPEWVEVLLKRGTADDNIARYVLSQPFSQHHPEWLETLLLRNSAGLEIAQNVLPQDHWKNHPGLKAALGGEKLNMANLRQAFDNGLTFHSVEETKEPHLAACPKSFAELVR